jgi:hypothetical protein
MKKIYISILFASLFSASTHAQLSLTYAANNPSVGDVTNMANYDSVSVIPKSTGTGQNWNFSNLTSNTFTEVTTYTTVGSTPQGASFPNATIAMLRGSNNYEYYKQSTGMLEYAGQADPGGKVVFSNMATWNNWPVAFGNSNTDAFSALETTPTATNNWNGTLSYTATGSGTVTLPGGFVHPNSLQLKKSINLTITGSSTASMSITQYYYYSSSVKYPILTVEYQTMTSGTVTSKSSYILVNTAAMTGVNEINVNNSGPIVFPNPAKDLVTISLPDNEIASSVEVFDLNGRKVLSAKNSNSIDVSELSRSIYVIRISAKEGVLQRKLSITE